MTIDLHTHSSCSDGTQTPDELMAAAAAAGLSVIGLTDHDCFDGWQAASVAAEQFGLGLVRGVEISCRFAGHGVHLLGYLPDPSFQPLQDELDRVLAGRNDRLPGIVAKLNELGIDLTEAEVRACSGETAATGRPHVADALVARGVVADRDEAFARFLGPGGPAYVDRYAADLEEMIVLLAQAGGVSVLAHPWAGRHDTSALDRAGIERLQAAGLTGIEVDHQDHTPPVRAELRAIASALGLVATGSSDHHGTGKVGFDLGVNTTPVEQFEELLGRARQAAEAAGRRVPQVIG